MKRIYKTFIYQTLMGISTTNHSNVYQFPIWMLKATHTPHAYQLKGDQASFYHGDNWFEIDPNCGHMELIVHIL